MCIRTSKKDTFTISGTHKLFNVSSPVRTGFKLVCQAVFESCRGFELVLKTENGVKTFGRSVTIFSFKTRFI
jgi:hypothetical protein